MRAPEKTTWVIMRWACGGRLDGVNMEVEAVMGDEPL
jgi:hypothetical protein